MCALVSSLVLFFVLRIHSVQIAMQLSGKKAVNVQRVLEHYDAEGSRTKLIGAQTFVLQKAHGNRRCASRRVYVSCIRLACVGAANARGWLLDGNEPKIR